MGAYEFPFFINLSHNLPALYNRQFHIIIDSSNARELLDVFVDFLLADSRRQVQTGIQSLPYYPGDGEHGG